MLASARPSPRPHGPDGLTFAALSRTSGLSGATLVQRFGSKPALLRAAMLHAWDQLDANTERAIADTPSTPEGAVAMLLALSHGYGDIETYAEGLLLLREDLRDPDLRARGRNWHGALIAALEARLAACPPGSAAMLLDLWQGSLLWWSFDPVDKVGHYVERRLRAFLALAAA